MKFLFMGTPDFAVPALHALHKNNYNIDLVITQKDRPRGRGKKQSYTPIKKKAIELGLNVYQPDNINSEESLNKIKAIKPDLIVVAAFGQILKKDLLAIPKYGCINIHASLLPKYRGAAPINWAIINGERESGITIMEMEEGLDTGDIIAQKALPILQEDDSSTLHDKLSILGSELLIETIADIISGKAVRVPQCHDKSSYASMIFKETGKIDWTKNGREILDLIRGVRPWPGAYTRYKGEVMKIYKLDIIDKCDKTQAGQIFKVNKEGIFVNTGDSTAIIKELQFPNKRRMLASEYLAGNDIEIGCMLK